MSQISKKFLGSNTVVDAKVETGAAIAYAKLNLSGGIINTDVSGSAAIALSKLAPTVGSRALATNIAGNIVASSTTDVELGYVNLVTGPIQAQLNAKASTTLTSAHILVGNGSNVATDVAVTGDISLTNAGVTAYSGTVPLNKGGTGQTTKAAAFDALQPMTTGGDIIYGGASGTGTRLANGSSGQFLKSNGGTAAPSWAAANNTNVYRAVSTYPDTVSTSDQILQLSGSSGVVNLPTAVGNAGLEFTFKHVGTTTTQVYTLTANGAETFDGGLTTYTLHTNGQSVTWYSDGAGWRSDAKVKIAGNVGIAYYPIQASTTWSRTSNTMGPFTLDTDAPSPTVESNPGPGTIQTTDNDLPQITINSLPPGQYRVWAFFNVIMTGSNQFNAFALSDGTTTTGEQGGGTALTGTAVGTSVMGTFTYTTAGNRTFAVYGRAVTNTINIQLSAARLLFVIDRLDDA